ncbi:methionyl-tRNA formyltransferase [Candidatus Magnetaquicoccus inordinatus]|uniref:methionyl-tRNA formyltransferase n=1 Tax=Candidatus Magnetaquicoccus inordinatus TaxID=2496818 RepID=UPI00102C6D93|nr:methionyl-tRNA formyltransferase [Candidatus Magnetaquicoccus inordinatus]
MKVLLFGITQFATRGLKRLIQLNHIPVGMVVMPHSTQDIDNIRLICQDYKIPVYAPASVNTPEFLSIVQNDLKPDLILTYTFSERLSMALIGSAPFAVNMHPSYLPYYRGNNPYFWPIANGETSTGVSYHFLSEYFDEGDLIFQQHVPIHPGDTSGLVIHHQEIVAADLLEKLMNLLTAGLPLPRNPQPQGDFVKAPKPTLQDYFIQWQWPSEKIINRIRALNPFTGAYTQYKNTVLAIYQASPSSYGLHSEPGTIVSLSPEGPLVKTGNGVVILKILTAGKKYLLSGSDFIEQEHLQVGDKLISWEG